MCDMDFIPTPHPVEINGSYWGEDGHPNNIGRADRYHVDEGGTICGCCAYEQVERFSTNVKRLHETMRTCGIERDPFDPAKDEADWCIVCNVDFTA